MMNGIWRWKSWAAIALVSALAGCAAPDDRVEYTDPDGGVWSCPAHQAGDCDPVSPVPVVSPVRPVPPATRRA